MKYRSVFKLIVGFALLSGKASCANPVTVRKTNYTNPVTVGNARFTIITPGLVRLEYQKEKKFEDHPTLFAKNRSMRTDQLHVLENQLQIHIDTEFFHLTYTDDGQSFHSKNLTIQVKSDPMDPLWSPGKRSTHNLGGAITSLDGVLRPIDLGEGLISREGWHLLDDSKNHILKNGWIYERGKEGTDWYFFAYGHDYLSAFKSLTSLSGKVPLPRRNTLGIWYSRYWPYSSSEFEAIVSEFNQYGFPLDNMVMDMDWHIPGWTGWTWNRTLILKAFCSGFMTKT
jgi:alpha-glucosidase (family GH31 glycosyl hydrolase)